MYSLVDTELTQLTHNGQITHQEGCDLSSHVQPASIDIPIGSTIYHVKQKFLPFQNTVQYITDKLSIQKLDTHGGCVLYKGQTYLIPCLDISLGKQLIGKISPKSSLGRIDVLIRAVVDNTGIYDTIPAHTQGDLWLEVTPQSFNIKIYPGNTLSQLMIFDIHKQKDCPDDKLPQLLFDREGIACKQTEYEGGILISAGIGQYEIIGYKARSTDEIIDLNRRDHQSQRFFDPLHISGSGDRNKVILEKDRFYIIPTKEQIAIPVEYSVERAPSTHLVGELRAHYAGFFDPGFGGETGATGVLEIRPYEEIVLYDGQPICLMHIYENSSIPSVAYGDRGNNYQHQVGPRLAKFFV